MNNLSLVYLDDSYIDHTIVHILQRRYSIFKKVTSFSDGTNLLDSLRSNSSSSDDLPDVMLVDLYMADYDGWAFLDDLSKLMPLFNKAISVYILSSSINFDDHRRAKKYPFVKDFLVKPLSKARLLGVSMPDFAYN